MNIPGFKRPKIKILNLYCGIGGNRNLWNYSNFEITAIDNDSNALQIYQKLYPKDKTINTDAIQYLLNNYQNYDIIWASPPCPTHSKARCYEPHLIDMSLWQIILFCQQYCKHKKWIIENVRVYYEDLIKPNLLLGRHSFWSNQNLSFTNYQEPPKPNKFDHMNNNEFIEYLGFKIPEDTAGNKNKMYRNCVHPKLALILLKKLIKPTPTLHSYLPLKNNGGAADEE